MNELDEALTLSNTRLLSAVYFSLLAIIATLTIDLLLYVLGVEQMIPTFKAITWAVIVAACFGALFGERIVHSTPPTNRHAFLWAFLMVIVALPFYSVGFLYLIKEYHGELFTNVTVASMLYLYVFVLIYSFILAGFWLAIVAGIAAMYLRSHLVYYILHGLSNDRKSPRKETENINPTNNDEHLKH